MKNSGLFLNMAKWCFLGLFFQVFMLLWFVFGVSGIVPKVLKCLFSQFFGAFVGWLILAYLGLEGLGVFVFLVFVFLFVLLLFLFCLLCFCFVVGLFWVLVLVLFFFFVFCFFLGFKGQVRWPKGPPHLALNPPYFVCFVFFFCFSFCFLEGLRVR